MKFKTVLMNTFIQKQLFYFIRTKSCFFYVDKLETLLPLRLRHFLDRSMLFKDHTKSYQKKHMKKGYTFDSLLEVTKNKYSLCGTFKECDWFTRLGIERKIGIPECDNTLCLISTLCVTSSIICNCKSHILKPLT